MKLLKEGQITFLKSFFKSMNPGAYEELVEEPMKKSMKYVPKLIFFGFIIMILLSIPYMMTLPSYINNEFSKFSSFKVTTDINTTSPVILTDKFNFLRVDTTQNATIGNSKILLTKNSVQNKPLPCLAFDALCIFYPNTIEIKDTKGYSNILSYKEEYSNLAFFIILAMLPSILLILYLYNLIKFSAIIFIAAGFSFIITRSIRYYTTFSQLLKVSIYAITITVMIDLVTRPFSLNLYGAHYAIFLVYLVFGISKIGQFEKKPKKDTMRGKYIDM